MAIASTSSKLENMELMFSQMGSSLCVADVGKRKGFTLMEISLVLAILVVLSAMAAPIFTGTLEQERLRKAAESIAADWTRTRSTAMQTGETQLWACQIATGNYSGGSAIPSTTEGSGSNSPTTSAADLLNQELSQTLPRGIVISQALISEADTVSTMSATTQSSESGTATIFFYPNGQCSYARLTVNSEAKTERTMSVVINGLAGTVRVLRGASTSGATQ